MIELRFIWDEEKNISNQGKHGVSFEEAKTVFHDEFALEFFDPDHSENEDRFLLLGMSYQVRILLVCHCYRQGESIIRIISARKATKKEIEEYKKGI